MRFDVYRTTPLFFHHGPNILPCPQHQSEHPARINDRITVAEQTGNHYGSSRSLVLYAKKYQAPSLCQRPGIKTLGSHKTHRSLCRQQYYNYTLDKIIIILQ
jgi:hypothetical protein